MARLSKQERVEFAYMLYDAGVVSREAMDRFRYTITTPHDPDRHPRTIFARSENGRVYRTLEPYDHLPVENGPVRFQRGTIGIWRTQDRIELSRGLAYNRERRPEGDVLVYAPYPYPDPEASP